MAEGHELKRKLEEALGHEVALDVVQKFNFWAPVSTWLITGPDTHVQWQNLVVGIFSPYCVQQNTLDVASGGTTGDDGKSVFRLRAFVCIDPSDSFAAPVNVVATPNSADPFFLTVQHSLVDGGKDVEITVSVWDPTGAPAPDIAFDWRCRVAYLAGSTGG